MFIYLTFYNIIVHAFQWYLNIPIFCPYTKIPLQITSAVTEVDNAGRSTEYIPRDLPTDEGPSTSAHNLSRLPAKELYKIHLQKQIRKSDMGMDLIQLQMEEKRLLIKKADPHQKGTPCSPTVWNEVTVH
ncbi:hypothetical protein Q7C36_001936 [Tachysurus vachellii]|uniref:Uncharacterized protein n=1 Tax=Tachysurus vachellii TaxID=175792 RepID=A0AA88TA96_TACVA|nr:hypothetical protein Q7C36_001936 [Tachysurus vachellii]